ncbi:MAG TPA: AAA family ATPase [Gemmatimonadales bacterium]|nr:AAA family ATPase [Gemmatimonadales bacterium]
MRSYEITLRNYRCFADRYPASIQFGEGFTALLGPNNAGKSAFLKFLYEFQPIWANLASPNFLREVFVAPGHIRNVGVPRGVPDQADLVCDFTDRPLTIEISCKPATRDPQIRLVRLTGDRSTPQLFKCELELSPSETTIARVEADKWFDHSGNLIDIASLTTWMCGLRDAMYVPAYRNAINEGSGLHYDLAVGTALVSQWSNWKSGESRSPKLAIQSVTEAIREMFGFKTLEINATQDGRSLTVFVDGRPYRLNDLGSGISQFIILFSNLAIRRPGVLLIDEPELNLHPALQLDSLMRMASFVRENAVCFATHSLGLARAAAERVYTFLREGDVVQVRPFASTSRYAQLLGEMSYASFQELGFSAILLVEGAHDVKTMQQFLRLLGKDHQVVVMTLGGASMISEDREIELAELTRITSAVYAIIDSERSREDEALSRPRQSFLETCARVKIDAHVLNRRCTESYFSDRAVKQALGESFQSLKAYETLSEAKNPWSKAMNWRIASEATREELLGTDLGVFLNSVSGS